VINAPAGAGKTRVLAEIAKAWREACLGPVIGITASQSARNTLAAGGIESYNSARFLGHLPGRRGANGHMPVGEGTLFAVDEASMMASPDLADLIALAEKHGGKVIVAGDTEQLQAANNGGGMSLLADRLGYVRLAEPPSRNTPPGAVTIRTVSARFRPTPGTAGDTITTASRPPLTVLAESSRQVEEGAKRHRDLAGRLTKRHRVSIPAEYPVHDISPTFPPTSAQRRTAILQPPKPEIPPSSWVLERAADRDREAAD